MLATPLGFILSLVGVLFKQDRRAGWLGLALTAAAVAVALLFGFC